MAGSGRRLVGTGLAIAIAAGGLAGCDSTQQKNARAKLGATRILASRKPIRVRRASAQVQVAHVALVRGRRRSAIVVTLRNATFRPLTDVPVSVGVRTRGGRRVLLNGRANLDWFQTHAAAVPAAGRATWIFTLRSKRLPDGRPYALAGDPPRPSISHAGTLPRVEASVSAGGGRALRVLVDNVSDVPQYGVQVYALVRVHGRYVAAGKAAIAHLGTGAHTLARIPLAGAAHGRAPHVFATPTNFE